MRHLFILVLFSIILSGCALFDSKGTTASDPRPIKWELGAMTFDVVYPPNLYQTVSPTEEIVITAKNTGTVNACTVVNMAIDNVFSGGVSTPILAPGQEYTILLSIWNNSNVEADHTIRLWDTHYGFLRTVVIRYFPAVGG